MGSLDRMDAQAVAWIFEGTFEIVSRCLTCGWEWRRHENFRDISLPVLVGESIARCLEEPFLEEIIDNYRCGNCDREVSIESRQLVLQAPNVLVLRMNRFDGNSDKIVGRIGCDLHHDLGLHADTNEEWRYRLVAVVEHEGATRHVGHYVAMARTGPNAMHLFNDSRVSSGGPLFQILSAFFTPRSLYDARR